MSNKYQINLCFNVLSFLDKNDRIKKNSRKTSQMISQNKISKIFDNIEIHIIALELQINQLKTCCKPLENSRDIKISWIENILTAFWITNKKMVQPHTEVTPYFTINKSNGCTIKENIVLCVKSIQTQQDISNT